MLKFALSAIACVLFLFFGGFIAGVALHDPDTCWLLGLGRWIVEHHCLPITDPFSSGVSGYASVGTGLPLMQYQWAAEILFYAASAIFGLNGLIVLSALLLFVAYALLPWNLLMRSGTPDMVSAALIVSAVILSSSRFLARPQLFTFLFLSALLDVLLARDAIDKDALKRQAIWCAAIMLLWANTHIFFPLGVGLLWLVCACRAAQGFLDKRPHLPWPNWLAIPAVGTAATLVNPWGIGLWVYFFRILRSTINPLVSENGALPPTDISALFLFGLSFFTAILCMRKTRQAARIIPPPISIVFITLSIFIGIGHSRLIALCPLLLIGAVSESFCAGGLTLPVSCQPAQTARMHLLNAVVVVLGALLVAGILPPTLPQGSAAFHPPFKAIDYLKQHRPAGQILNDPQFGSMMDFYCEKPDVFIDTRFSMFEEQRVADYQRLALLQPGWQEILDHYRFDWAFLPPGQPLAQRLAQNGWVVQYQDADATILTLPRKAQ